MKKLMFALIAGVAVAAAKADVNSGTSFENFADSAITTGSKEGEDVNTYFRYEQSGSSDNGSTVKTYGGDNAAAHALDRNAYFTGTNAKYLDLSTDGGTLYRTVNDCSTALGDPQAVPAGGFWIDTIVQFTVCDSAPTIDAGAKLAIWLQADEETTPATTNLMVRAKTFGVTGDEFGSQYDSGTTNDFVLAVPAVASGITKYEAGVWYRLTVEAVNNVFNSDSGLAAAGFKIRINGYEVKAANGATSITGADAATIIAADTSDVAGLLSTGDSTTFISLTTASVELGGAAWAPELSAVGFSGTGSVDDILFTDTNPFYVAPSTFDFTVTFASPVSGVRYSIDGAAAADAASGVAIAVPVGSTITLTPAATVALPMFFTVADAGATTNYFSGSLAFGAAGAVEIGAADAATASGPAAEAAATNAVASKATSLGVSAANAAAAAANVQAAAGNANISVAAAAAWVESYVITDTAYNQLASADADDVAAAVGFDMALTANPQVEVTEMAEGANDAFALTFQVTDGTTAKTIGSYIENYVKSLVKMSAGLTTWSEIEKTVSISTVSGDATKLRATVTPTTKPAQAFMKIGD